MSTGSTVNGGAPGAGRVDLDWIQRLATFKTLLLHTPSPNAPANLSPLVTIPTADVPNGATEYLVPAPAPGQNARFDGTYTIVAVAYSWHTTSARTVTITIKQYEYPGGPSVSVAVPQSVTPASPAPGEGNGVVIIDNVTLPVRGLPEDNTSAYFTITVTSSDTADRFMDVIFLDTEGQFVLVNLPSGGYTSFYVDPPAKPPLGQITGTLYDRPQAASVLGANSLVSGEPLLVYPGDQWLLAYAVEGQPSLQVTYQPRFWEDQPGLAGAT